jgi:hypothetical protein
MDDQDQKIYSFFENSLNVACGNFDLAMCFTLNHLEWMWGIIILNFSFKKF